jgi:NAD(P)-dependent dehydrogenase (short-subunit alcohol dehydrogenase family)
MEGFMTQAICVVTGVGPGTGSALARRFARGGYRVAMLARDIERLSRLEREIPGCKGFACDVSDAAQVEATADRIGSELGAPEVLVHNAVGGAFGTFLEIDPAVLNRNFQINTMGLLYLARRFAPDMVSKGQGTIIVTGNTSALRGRAGFAGFAPTKAAQRILAEAMARDLGPKGVHVAYIVIDAVIDVPRQRERFNDRPDEFFVSPAAIAEEAFHLTQQDRSAWSFNVELRPYGEIW